MVEGSWVKAQLLELLETSRTTLLVKAEESLLVKEGEEAKLTGRRHTSYERG